MAVAAQEIAAGSILRSSQIRVELFPRMIAPPGALSSAGQAAGRVALTALHQGEAVTDTRLARVRAGPVASLVPQGFRAFAVPTTLSPALLRAGDLVDLLATFGSDNAHTELVAGGLRILSVLGGSSGQAGLLDASGSGAQDAATLLLLVTPDQELQVAAAASVANLEVTIDPAD